MPLLTAITTCKGRLQHLMVTLPTLMALPDCEVVVVDYDCPEGAGDWVRATYPAAKVVQVSGRPFFNPSEARNRGAATATTPWLLLIDVDVVVSPTLIEEVRDLLQPGVFLRPAGGGDLTGTMIVAREDFIEVGGYDEVFEGWGSEDLDVMGRLTLGGRRTVWLPSHLLTSIPHGDDLRGRFHEITDSRYNGAINAVYRHAKLDLLRLGVTYDAAARRVVYEQLRRAALEPGGLTSLEIAFREESLTGPHLTASLRYQLRWPEQNAAPPLG